MGACIMFDGKPPLCPPHLSVLVNPLRDGMQVLWSSTEAAVVTGGRTPNEWRVSGVSINVNDIRAGDLFLASGDDDLRDVVRRGAGVIACPNIGSRGAMDAARREIPVPIMEIGSAFMALQNLADAARFRTHAYVVGIQGTQARAGAAHLLAKNSQIHDGGHHVSLGLANLPENVDYAVFGASPMVKPDIAVITSPSTSYRDTLFETMPRGGAVLVNADDDAYLDIIARVRAAGILTILTYGINAAADIRMSNIMTADNGVRVDFEFCGQAHRLALDPRDMPDDPAVLLCAAGILKLTGRFVNVLSSDTHPPASADNDMARARPHQSASGVTLLDNLPAQKPRAAIMRVRNLIDLGRGGQTAILQDIFGGRGAGASVPNAPRYGADINTPAHKRGAQSYGSGWASPLMLSANPPLSLPHGVADMNIVHAGRRIQTVNDPRRAIRGRFGKNTSVDQVSADALAPGDFLVFREIWNSSKTLFSEALRCTSKRKRA